MRHLLKVLLLLLLRSFTACTNSPPSWLLEKHHAVSPDGKAYVYQSVLEAGDSVQISIATHIMGPMVGGGGVFDVMMPGNTLLDLHWLSDSTVVIGYPAAARILRQETSTQFFKRHTYFEYTVIDE